MKFKSLSATALENAIECPARFEATNILRAADESNDMARVGTAVHAALELYVRTAVVEQDEKQDKKHLQWCYRNEYPKVFGALDMSSTNYMDGVILLNNWFDRTSFKGFEVLLLETKESFDVPLPGGESRPFNYIFDRLDYLGNNEYRVVDYKTIRANLTYEQLRRKLQARVYGLAAQIRHKDAKRIFVEFDLLRHTPVGVVYTRDENANTWRLIKSKAAELWLMDEPEEQLNPNCRYCVRAAGCATLQSNIAVGGIEHLTIEQMVDMRLRLDSQAKGISSLVDEIDIRVLLEMERRETLTLEGDIMGVAEASFSSRRSVTDPSAIADIVGPDIASRYGSFRLGDIDRMFKEEVLTAEQQERIKRFITKSHSAPTIKSRFK